MQPTSDLNRKRHILHVDMDAFYASVEERDDPRLAGKPVVVGGSPTGRGVVSAANYHARRYGVHSAMPAAQARRLCPQAVFVRPRMGHYVQVSHDIRCVFRRFTPIIEPLSLDEAFLDVSASLRLFGSARAIGTAIRGAIRTELGLPASVGIAGNKFLAKLVCTLAKPDGLKEVPEDALEFLRPLPVTCLWGVGASANEQLSALGIHTIGDLARAEAGTLSAALGRGATRLRELARGHDERPVVTDAAAKSISHESTFEMDVDDVNIARAWVFSLAEQVARRARDSAIAGRTVRLKLRYGDFTTVSRARSLSSPVNDTDHIATAAIELLQEQLGKQPGAVRLLGVGLANFDALASNAQRDLFETSQPTAVSELDDVADRIAQRFGSRLVSRARTLNR